MVSQSDSRPSSDERREARPLITEPSHVALADFSDDTFSAAKMVLRMKFAGPEAFMRKNFVCHAVVDEVRVDGTYCRHRRPAYSAKTGGGRTISTHVRAKRRR